MSPKISFGLGMALATIAVCCFVESSFGQDALVASLVTTENDDSEAEDKDDKDDKSRRRRTHTASSLRSGFLTRPVSNVSLGLTSVDEAAEVETVVGGITVLTPTLRGAQFRDENAAARRAVSFYHQERVRKLRLLSWTSRP